MKRQLLALLLLTCLVIPASSVAWMTLPVVGGGVEEGAVCNPTPAFDFFSIDTTYGALGLSASDYWGGQSKFQVGASAHQVCKVAFKLSEIGNLTGFTIVAKIWTLSGNNLDAIITDGTSTAVPCNNCNWSETEVEFTFSGNPSLEAATNYAITLETGSSDASNYLRQFYTNDDASGYSGQYERWNDDKTQAASFATLDTQLKVYYYE